ncbi:hypothetical protein [Pseudonocardia sp. N23]|uniref:hypothetical protein n=1 Tax=Pseudonocardia sp. N23 TaxID=1987376 RepID=UPI000BFE5E0C|nr:hypothetical protein [Pseudonocardia sp. N23]GAY12368.1 hypothetical protein TOK_0763 [Pseudonocardia sp. N23]
MPDGPVSFTGRHALRPHATGGRLRRPSPATSLMPGDVADLLLDGEPGPHPVTALLTAACRPGTAHELRGEAAARQAFVDAMPLAVPVALPTARERHSRHRRMRAVRTVVTAKVVGIAALTLTAGGVAVAATGPSGAPAEERISDGAVPGADVTPGAELPATGRAPAAGPGTQARSRTGGCGPVTGAAIADLARVCGDPGDDGQGDRSDDRRAGLMAFGSPDTDARRGAPDLRDPPPAPPATAPPTTGPPTTAPPTTAPPQAGSGAPAADAPASAGPATPPPTRAGAPGAGTGGQGSGRDQGRDESRGQGRDQARDGSGTTSRTTPPGKTGTPVTGRGAPPSP